MSDIFKPKDQIAYIPTHAEGDINHPDVELGFVTGRSGGGVFCRYWSKYSPGLLRTTANSESTPEHLLVHHYSVKQRVVDELYTELGYD